MSLWRRSAGYAIGRAFASIIILLFMPILTRLMTPEQFGLWQVLGFWSSIVMVIAQLGLDQAFFRFFILEKNKQGQILFSTVAVICLSAIAIISCAWVFRCHLARLILGDQNYEMLIFATALWGITDAFFFTLGSILQAQEKVSSFVIIDILRTAIGYVGAVWLLKIGLGVSGVISLWVLAGFVIFIFAMPSLTAKMTFKMSASAIKPMLRYGLPLALNMFIIKILTSADRWLMAMLGDFQSAGIYSAAMRIAGIVGMAIIPIRYAWTARMFNMHAQKMLVNKLPEIWRQLSCGMALFTICFALFSRELFRIIVGPGYESGATIVPLLAVIFFMDALMLIADAGIYVLGKTIFVPIFAGIAAITNVALNMLLIPEYGMYGAAISAISSYTILLALGWRMGQYFLPIKIPYIKVFLAIAAVVVSVIIAIYVDHVALRSVAFVVVGLAVFISSSLGGDILRLFYVARKFLKN